MEDDWFPILARPMYDLPKVLGEVVEFIQEHDPDYTFEQEVNPDDVGHCAIHMEWSESMDVHFVKPGHGDRSKEIVW
jgi:hypothetical protein